MNDLKTPNPPKKKSVVNEARDIGRAIDLVKLGARLQMLEAEISLSRERLLKLYKEVKGESPPKGMLPFSTDWFMTWQPNVHASLFMAFYGFLKANSELRDLDLIIKAYRMYLEKVEINGLERVLSLTRAWTMIRFFDVKLLQMASCELCAGEYVRHAYELSEGYVCGLCHIPARAGKARRPMDDQIDAADALPKEAMLKQMNALLHAS